MNGRAEGTHGFQWKVPGLSRPHWIWMNQRICDAANMDNIPQTRRLSWNLRLYMRLFIIHMDTDNVVLCFADPKLDKEMHTAAEPGAIVSTTIKYLSRTMAALDSPWLPYRKPNFDGSKQKSWLLDRQTADCWWIHPGGSAIYVQLWSTS